MSEQPIDAFMCVHQRDIGYLFETVLESYRLNFLPRRRLVLVTNDQPFLTDYIAKFGFGDEVVVTSDDQWLSRRELELPGWFRQQIIKLRAYEFCESKHFCNVGADTVLLQPVSASDLIADGSPILYYRSHPLPTIHWFYELQRVLNDGRILNLAPLRALRYIDFINDLFCFDRDMLLSLNRSLSERYGNEPYHRLLAGLTTTPRDQKKFGEWTLYSIYVLDTLRQQVRIRDAAQGFLHQVHSARDLRNYHFDSKAVHFVGKQFDVAQIKRQIASRGTALGERLLAADAISGA